MTVASLFDPQFWLVLPNGTAVERGFRPCGCGSEVFTVRRRMTRRQDPNASSHINQWSAELHVSCPKCIPLRKPASNGAWEYGHEVVVGTLHPQQGFLPLEKK